MGLQTKLHEGDSIGSVGQTNSFKSKPAILRRTGTEPLDRRCLHFPLKWPRSVCSRPAQLVRQITDGSGSNLQPLEGGRRSRRVSGGSAGCRRGQTEHLTVRKQQQWRRRSEPAHNKAGKSPIKRYISL